MKRLLLICLMCLCLPATAQAVYITGVDDTSGDRKPNIGMEEQKLLDDSILTYYQSPSVEKINNILDIMTQTPLLERKTAWAPLVGFFTIVFPNNKDHVMAWISRNDYNEHAQYVIVNALLHAHMRETALLFAKAHKWDAESIYRLREHTDMVDLNKLIIVLPGHIDTLWGAFFASGNVIYVDQIIENLLTGKIPEHAYQAFMIEDGTDILSENKVLAATTLRDYARDHKPVREALEKRYNAEPDSSPVKKLFKEMLGK